MRWLTAKRLGIGLLGLIALCALAHFGVVAASSLTPPSIEPAPVIAPPSEDGVRRLGRSWLTRRGSIHEMSLAGSPEEIGAAHALLARHLELANEQFLQTELRRYLPGLVPRGLVMDAVRLRNRKLDQSFRPERLREIAAQARAFQPDPFDSFLPTYQRFVYLHALYDTALALEGSPMLGCTAFVASGRATADGHTWIGRNFDAEIGEPFDTDKVVLAFRQRGKVPFVSVSWAGMGGVVTGLSGERIFAAIHGARAGEPREDGVPATEILREVLETARTLDEAVVIAERRTPMVSHLLLLADGRTGESVVLERSPELSARLDGGETTLLTNHYRTGLSADPKDAVVRERTTTLDRFARLEERVAELAEADPVTGRGTIDAARVLSVLRDRRGVGGVRLAPGDRRAIDAQIATHSVIADATAGVIWVSEGPHADGRYVRFDLSELFAEEGPPRPPRVEAMPAVVSPAPVARHP